MPRYKLEIEYDGTGFVGWQRQENGPSVQQSIEEAVEKFCGTVTNVPSAGRTDSGVHARAMVAHVDIDGDYQGAKVRDAINFHLKPRPIAILSAERVSEEFHARFSCVRRAYEYRITNRRMPLALDVNRTWRVWPSLDADAMDDAAQVLVGRHDFTTFRSVKCQSESAVKSLEEISVMRAGEDVFIRCAARSFLHNQVRSFAGTLAEVGKGKWTKRDLSDALNAADRARCGPVAPPEGLYFIRADYAAGNRS
ncbi:tRNA pseudouridine(38-40) synthase TruA [Hyphococcus lacteus]|uniref:tRNA pseudouridine synthase A n=1 Tax=Hyphococcus lacteus TaxID=3143536 RepID=A0ABV3Z209_9PROT